MDAENISVAKEYDDLVGEIRKVSKFEGIWPLGLRDVGGDADKLQTARALQRCFMVFIMFYMSALAVAMIADVVNTWGNMEKTTEYCVNAASYILVVFRLTIYGNQRDNIILVVERMRNDWISAAEEDRAIYKKKCRPAFVISKIFNRCVVIVIFGSSLIPVIEMYILGSDQRTLPFGGYFGFNVEKTPMYQIMYGLELISGVFGSCNVIAVVGFNLISIIHASANFNILQKHLAALRSDDGKSPELLRLCIQEHQRAIEFAEALEEVINKVALCQFVLSTGLVCFAGIQITSMLDDKLRLLKYSVYLGSAIFELFIFSYSGYRLTLESELVGNAAFNSDWVGSPFTQNLRIIMLRATKPNTITAAKFYDMSLESFSMVLSSSFSYFTTLRAVKEE